MVQALKIGVIGGGFGPGTGPDTYSRALAEALGERVRPVTGDGEGLDLVHVVDAKRVSPRLLDRLRPPIVLDFHDYYWTLRPDYPAPDRALRLLRQRQLHRHHLAATRHAAAVIVHSQVVARATEQEIRALGLPRPPAVCIVPYMIPPEAITPAGETRPAPAPPLILLVGRDLFRKGFDVLLKALPRVREVFPEVRAMVVGREYFHTRLAAKLMGRGQVEFPGHQDPAALRRLVERATVVVLPSHQEALPISVLEAMAAGTPVVASNVGGIPEAVEDGVSGLLHRPGDPADLAEKILRVLSEPGLREVLVAGGRARVAEFGPGPMASALEAAHAAALEARS